MKHRIGFMQGRLSKIVDGRIQSFPWDSWREELPMAASIDLNIMEWTLDQERLYDNPLMTDVGKQEIRSFCNLNNVSIPSVTGDCFMQAPFWKEKDPEIRKKLHSDFRAIIEACGQLEMEYVVVPLVDNGRIESIEEENDLIEFLYQELDFLKKTNIKIVFESDFQPSELARLISRLPYEVFGVNYDIGNSAALGFDPEEEFEAYGSRILNVHVKDRILNGNTVPLGEGNADFKTVFSLLKVQNYSANYILQTARAKDEKHMTVLNKYKEFVLGFI